MSDTIRLSSVAVNCPDAPALAAFYADITAGEVVIANAAWAIVDGPGGRLDFQTVADHVPPTWPHAAVPMQMHLDFLVDDLDAAAARVVAAGATKLRRAAQRRPLPRLRRPGRPPVLPHDLGRHPGLTVRSRRRRRRPLHR